MIWRLLVLSLLIVSPAWASPQLLFMAAMKAVASVPAAPSAPTLATASGSITPSWSAVSGATSYNVYWMAGSAPTAKDGSDGATKITGTTSGTAITGLTDGTTYYFCVTAVNAIGESALSASANAVPSVPVSVTDSFNRADGALGSNWLTASPSAAPLISTNVAAGQGTGVYAAVYNETFAPNQSVQVDLVSLPSGVILRGSDTLFTRYQCYAYFAGNDTWMLLLNKIVAGTASTLATTDVTGDDGEGGYFLGITQIRANIVGSSITIDTYDGTSWANSVISITDSTITSGSPGIILENTGSIDNFSAGDL